MIKKDNRLNKNNDFDRVFKTGRSVYTKALGLKLVPNELSFNRYGFLVGLKISKKAVARNKIKRQLKAVLRQEENKLIVGYDLVFITFPLILAKNYQEIRADIITLLKRAKLYE